MAFHFRALIKIFLVVDYAFSFSSSSSLFAVSDLKYCYVVLPDALWWQIVCFADDEASPVLMCISKMTLDNELFLKVTRGRISLLSTMEYHLAELAWKGAFRTRLQGTGSCTTCWRLHHLYTLRKMMVYITGVNLNRHIPIELKNWQMQCKYTGGIQWVRALTWRRALVRQEECKELS